MMNNTAFGYSAGYQITTGTPNTAIGYYAMGSNGGGVTGSNNTAVGNVALTSLSTGNYNTALGDQAMYNNTTASNNTGIGYQAGYSITTASYNTSIGYQTGGVLTTGTGNTYVGYGINASGTGVNFEIVLGSSTTGKGSQTGFINPGGGGVYQGNNSAAWSVASDRRLKKNIVDNTEGLSIISQIRVRNFEYRTAEEVTELPAHTVIEKTGVQLGVIAQELLEVCGDCVKTESTGVMSVNSDNITWHMINAIKDLKAELDTVKAELAALKG